MIIDASRRNTYNFFRSAGRVHIRSDALSAQCPELGPYLGAYPMYTAPTDVHKVIETPGPLVELIRYSIPAVT